MRPAPFLAAALGLLAATASRAVAGPALAMPCYPHPGVLDHDIEERLPPGHLYILLDDAIAPEDVGDPVERSPVPGVPSALHSETWAWIDATSVTARGRTVRVGDRWHVLLRDRSQEVTITRFGRYEEDVDGVRAWDEVFAVAPMPQAMLRACGDCSRRPRPRQFLASPRLGGTSVPEAVGAEPDVPRAAFLQELANEVDPAHRDQLPKARLELLRIVQDGERRTVAALELVTDDCTDYGCVSWSWVRIYGPEGVLRWDGSVERAAVDVQAGDSDLDGNDEVVVCGSQSGWRCRLVVAEEGGLRVEPFVQESGC